MNIKCIIVEDEPLARKLLADYISKVSSLQLVAICSNSLEAMEALKREPIDLMFLDIQMPEITGISLLKILNTRPLVVLTTAYSEYALESYELDVVDYLLKPITLERFLKAVDKVHQRLALPQPVAHVSEKPASDFIFVKDGTKLVKVKLNEVLYVEGLKDYVIIHTSQQKIVSLQRLKSLEEQLPSNQFFRVHHSYIINLQAIETVHKGEVQIGDSLIPISESYRKTFKEFIDRNQIQ